ncbi:hypothetical protein LINPERHAP2_LOCUS26138 [Linum perenne]
MKRRLEAIWAKVGHIQVSDMANNFFLVRFSSSEDYQRAAFKGPWKIFDYYISVARWSPNFKEDEPIRTILFWVRLPKLPIHYFNNVAVSRIGNCIGRTVRLDLATKEGARGRYARVCVELDVSKPLLGKYILDDRVMHIEYESLENICFDCGFYGHKLDHCPRSPPKADSAVSTETGKQVAPEETEEGDTGSWMTVSRRHKSKKKDQSNQPKEAKASGSRFSPLETPDEMEQPKQKETPLPKDSSSKPVTADTEPHVEMAKALAKVFTDSSLYKEVVATASQVKPTEDRQRLADVTNNSNKPSRGVGKGKKKAQGSHPEIDALDIDDSNLVSVPVTFDNPIFQSTSASEVAPTSSQAKKGKAKIAKSKAGPSSGKKVDPPKRTFKKTNSAIPVKKSDREDQRETIEGLAKARKPPDLSC